MPLEISDIVRVSTTIRPRGVIRKELGRTLFLTKDATLDASGSGKVGSYSNFAGVAEKFATDTEPYKAGLIYFQQSPLPKNFLVGRVANVASPAKIVGGAIAAFNVINAIGLSDSFTEGGESRRIRNLEHLNSYSTLLGELNAVGSFDGKASITNGVITLISNDITGLSYYGGNDPLLNALGLTASSGARYLPQVSVETATQALDAIRQVDDSFYFLTLASDLNSDSQAASIWAGANNVMYSGFSSDQSVLTAAETASVPAQISALKSPRTFLTWSATADYKDVSIAGRFSSVNFAAPNSLITAKFKSLTGTLSDNLTTSQKQEIDRKLINHYSPFSTDSIYAEGTTCQPGTWIDVQYWLDWFTNATQVDLYNALRSSNRIPQTLPGMQTLVEVIEGVCRQGVVNGGIAPGKVSPALAQDIRNASGDADFDGVLTNGYLIVAGSIAAQSQSVRATRAAPPISVYLKGSGAIHSIEVVAVFEN